LLGKKALMLLLLLLLLLYDVEFNFNLCTELVGELVGFQVILHGSSFILHGCSFSELGNVV
jgi:hypothetical protein